MHIHRADQFYGRRRKHLIFSSLKRQTTLNIISSKLPGYQCIKYSPESISLTGCIKIVHEIEGIFTQHIYLENIQFDRGFYCINYCGLYFNHKQASSRAIALKKKKKEKRTVSNCLE